MRKLIFNISQSFNNGKDGYSARKLSAFYLLLCSGLIHYKADFHNETIATWFLIADLIGAFLLLGVITVEQIFRFKEGNNEDK